MSQVTTAPARRTMRPVKRPVEKPAEKPCPDLPSFYRLLREHRNDLKGRWGIVTEVIATEVKKILRFIKVEEEEEQICPLEFLWLALSGEMKGFRIAGEKLGLSDKHWRKIVDTADDNFRGFYNPAIRQWLLWATGLNEKEPATAK